MNGRHRPGNTLACGCVVCCRNSFRTQRGLLVCAPIRKTWPPVQEGESLSGGTVTSAVTASREVRASSSLHPGHRTHQPAPAALPDAFHLPVVLSSTTVPVLLRVCTTETGVRPHMSQP